MVTTPGVLPHIPRAGRERLLAALRDLDAVWISIDPPGLHEAWRSAGRPGDVGRVRPRSRRCSAGSGRSTRRVRGVARGRGRASRVSVGACPSPTAIAPSSPSRRMAPARRGEGRGDPRRSRPVAGAVLPAARPPHRHRRSAGARPDARQAAAAPARRARAGRVATRVADVPLTAERVCARGVLPSAQVQAR